MAFLPFFKLLLMLGQTCRTRMILMNEIMFLKDIKKNQCKLEVFHPIIYVLPKARFGTILNLL